MEEDGDPKDGAYKPPSSSEEEEDDESESGNRKKKSRGSANNKNNTSAGKELEERQRLVEKHSSSSEKVDLTNYEANYLGTSYCERVFHEYKYVSNEMLMEEDKEDSIMKGAFVLLRFDTADLRKKKRLAVRTLIKYQTGRFREYFVSSVKKSVLHGEDLGK